MCASPFIAGSTKDSGDPVAGETAAAQKLAYWGSDTTEKMIHPALGDGEESGTWDVPISGAHPTYSYTPL